MIVEALITLKDDTEIVRWFDSYVDLGAWADRHWKDILSYSAHTKGASQ